MFIRSYGYSELLVKLVYVVLYIIYLLDNGVFYVFVNFIIYLIKWMYSICGLDDFIENLYVKFF